MKKCPCAGEPALQALARESKPMAVRNKLTDMMGLQVAPGLNGVLEAIGVKLQQIALIARNRMV